MVARLDPAGRPISALGRPISAPGRPNFAAYDPAMLLAVDVGNSNVTIGSFRNGSLVAVRRAATPRGGTADELELLVEGLLRLDDAAFADVSAVVVASVVPAVSAALEAVTARRDRPLLLAGAGTVPLPIRVDRPGEVGADRLVNALAISRLYGTPGVVVDLGTATTFDCVATTARSSAARSRRASSWGSRPSPRGRRSSHGWSSGRPIGRSGETPSRRSRAARCSATQDLVAGLLAQGAARAGRRRRRHRRGRPRRAHRRPVAGAVGRSIDGVEAIDPDLTLKGLAILHAEVAGGPPLKLQLS